MLFKRNIIDTALGTCHLLEGRERAGANFFYQVYFLYALPQFSAEKTVTLPLM